jgi:hypothetical protein
MMSKQVNYHCFNADIRLFDKVALGEVSTGVAHSNAKTCLRQRCCSEPLKAQRWNACLF